MHPEWVESASTGTDGKDTLTNVRGRKPRIASPDADIIGRNIIRPYHDLYFVRAGVSYVTTDERGNNVFVFVNVGRVDPSEGAVSDGKINLPNFNELQSSQYNDTTFFSIEGVKAIYFERDPIDMRDAPSSVTVYVITEGDSTVEGRDNTKTANMRQILEQRTKKGALMWEGITFDPKKYYEEFHMRWRTRNVEKPEPLNY
jgi:hypothetical protein